MLNRFVIFLSIVMMALSAAAFHRGIALLLKSGLEKSPGPNTYLIPVRSDIISMLDR